MLEFDNVYFSYSAEDSKQQAIEDFSLTVQPGQSIAIVGPSGAGKSMLARLLARFWDVDKGAIVQALSDDVLWLEQHISFTSLQMLVDVCVLSCLLASALWFSASIALGATVCLFAAIFLLFGLRAILLAKLRERSDNLTRAASKALDYCQGLYVLLAFFWLRCRRPLVVV